MIFDGYAAGLPLVAFGIDYVLERDAQEHATLLMLRDKIEDSALRLVEVDSNRVQLAGLARFARDAAVYHSADNWYRRRAEWTVEAVDRHKLAGLRSV